MFAAPPGLKQPQRRAIIPARLACFVDEQCGDTLNMSSNYPSTPPPPLRPPAVREGRKVEVGSHGSHFAEGRGHRANLLHYHLLASLASPYRQTKPDAGGCGLGAGSITHTPPISRGGRLRIHWIPQQSRSDTEGRRWRNAEDANRKHMSASEKFPSDE